MPPFPRLDSGAIAQYPLPFAYRQPVQVLRFLDGTDQRFLTLNRPLRRWLIDLSLLNESEVLRLQAFYEAVSGQYSMFQFPDPVSGELVNNCRFGDSALELEWEGISSGSSKLWVVETNG